ncbi:hypothetical protein DFJ77DRAFT_437429 [Powellomyces hirtus]|nr:hypothetical protein DFJ77DRAFT_437429 [Powellomyces hirtus]
MLLLVETGARLPSALPMVVVEVNLPEVNLPATASQHKATRQACGPQRQHSTTMSPPGRSTTLVIAESSEIGATESRTGQFGFGSEEGCVSLPLRGSLAVRHSPEASCLPMTPAQMFVDVGTLHWTEHGVTVVTPIGEERENFLRQSKDPSRILDDIANRWHSVVISPSGLFSITPTITMSEPATANTHEERPQYVQTVQQCHGVRRAHRSLFSLTRTALSKCFFLYGRGDRRKASPSSLDSDEEAGCPARVVPGTDSESASVRRLSMWDFESNELVMATVETVCSSRGTVVMSWRN